LFIGGKTTENGAEHSPNSIMNKTIDHDPKNIYTNGNPTIERQIFGFLGSGQTGKIKSTGGDNNDNRTHLKDFIQRSDIK
jgi:hypothetical protein